MGIQNRNTLKSWFVRGAKPLASQFADWIDSYWHKNDNIPIDNIENLSSNLNEKANCESVTNLENRITIIENNDNTSANIQKSSISNSSIIVEKHSQYLPANVSRGHRILLTTNSQGEFCLSNYKVTFKINPIDNQYVILFDTDAVLEKRTNDEPLFEVREKSFNPIDYRFESGFIELLTGKFNIKPCNGYYRYWIQYYDESKILLSVENFTLLGDWQSESRQSKIDKIEIREAPQGAKYMKIVDVNSESYINGELPNPHIYLNHLEVFHIYTIDSDVAKNVGLKSTRYNVVVEWNDQKWNNLKVKNAEINVRKYRLKYTLTNGRISYSGRYQAFHTPHIELTKSLYKRNDYLTKLLINSSNITVKQIDGIKIGLFIEYYGKIRNGIKNPDQNYETIAFNKIKKNKCILDIDENTTREDIEGVIAWKVKSENRIKLFDRYLLHTNYRSFRTNGFISYYKKNRKNSRKELIGRKYPVKLLIRNISDITPGIAVKLQYIDNENFDNINIFQ